MNRIRCINKQDRDNIYERITHIGGINSSWNNWKLTQKAAIQHIKTWKYNFYVEVNWVKTNVIIAKSRFWNEYLKTENDWDEPNNLLSLPECIS